MAMPVNVFGRHGDVADLAYRLLGALEGPTVETALGSARVRGRLPETPDGVVTVEVTTEHLGGPQGDGQRAGMARWLARSELSGPGRSEALDLVDGLVVSVAFVIDEAAGQDVVDAVVDLAVRVASWADGFVVAMASDVVLGPDGEVWLEPADVGRPEPVDDRRGTPDVGSDGGGSDGVGVVGDETDVDPFVDEARRVLAAGGVPEHGVVLDAELADAVPAAEPPGLDRVARRLIVTAACAARALTEAEGDHVVEARAALLDWVEETGAAVELESWEATLLTTAPGELAERDRIDGSWRTEAAVVLAWALGLAVVPAPHEVVDPGAVFASIGLASPEATADALDAATPRSADQVEVLRQQLLTISWRLVEHRLRPRPMDLAVEVREHPWGPLTVAGLPLLDGDLAIGDRPLTSADPEAVRMASSIAVERQRAATWLVEGGSFADTDLST